MLAVLAFLKSPLGRYAAIALAILALGLTLRSHWIHVGKASEQKAEASRLEKARKEVAKREVKAAEISSATDKKVAQDRVRIEYRTKTLIEKVPTYVQIDPARPSLSVGFIRLHDAAATGVPEVADPAGRPDSSPSGITDPQLATVVIGNYGACHEALARAEAWESWYGQIQKEFNR